MLQSYAADYRSKALTDEKAKKLLDEWIAIEQDEVMQRKASQVTYIVVKPPQ
jgi:hypothetical protein